MYPLHFQEKNYFEIIVNIQPVSGEKHKGLVSLEFVLMNMARHLPIPRAFVRCFLHILATQPTPRKGYFLLPDVIKSKDYKMLFGCCMLTNTECVQQDIGLQPHTSEITCTSVVGVWRVITHLQSNVKVTLCACKKSGVVCSFREPNIYTLLHASLETWDFYVVSYV